MVSNSHSEVEARPAGVVCEDFKPRSQNTLRGFARVRFRSGLVIAEITLHVTNGRAWASPPARQMLDRNGTPLRDENGKTRWQPLITFATRAHRDDWSDRVVAAVLEAYPDALAAEHVA
jgi:hypothetical protein